MKKIVVRSILVFGFLVLVVFLQHGDEISEQVTEDYLSLPDVGQTLGPNEKPVVVRDNRVPAKDTSGMPGHQIPEMPQVGQMTEREGSLE